MSKLCPFRIPNTEPPLYNVVTGYGAHGDGVTDDTAHVQAAIDAAGAVGNGAIVYFPAGTYLTNKLTILSNIELRGPFTSGTPRATTWAATLKHKASNNFSHIRVEDKTNVTYKYLAFDGNGANQAAGYNHYYYGTSNVLYDSCYFTGYWKDVSTDFPATQFATGANITIRDSTSYDCDALAVIGMLDSPVTNALVDNCLNTQTVTGRSETVAFYGACSGSSCIDSVFIGCKTAIACQGVAVHDNLIDGNTITNPKYGLTAYDGAYSNTFQNNVITAGAKSTGKGINVSGAAYGNQFLSNHISDWVDQTDYCIWHGASASNTFDGNHITGSHNVVLSTPCAFQHNEIGTATVHAVWMDAACSGMVLHGNNIHDSQRCGLWVHGALTNAVFSDNTFQSNSLAGSGSYAGIAVTTALVGATFTGNHSHGTNQTKGVDIVAGSTGTYSADNDMSGNIGAPTWGGLTAA